MEEKKTIKISLSTFFLIIAIITICVMGFFIFKLNDEKNILNQKNTNLDNEIASLKIENEKNAVKITSNTTIQTSENNNALASTTTKTELSETEALTQATNTYKTAYNMFYSEQAMIPGKYSPTGEEKFGCKVNISEFEKVFSKRAIAMIKNKLIEHNGEYYDIKTNDYYTTFFESIDPGSIFSATDSGMRTLSIADFTDKYIIADGKLPVSEYNSGDETPERIIFVKENGKWLIDIYE